jgi:hypothetical protein
MPKDISRTSVRNVRIYDNEKEFDIQRTIFGTIMEHGVKYVEAYRTDFYHDAQKLQKVTRELIAEEIASHKKQFTMFWAMRRNGTEMYIPAIEDNSWWNANESQHENDVWNVFAICIRPDTDSISDGSWRLTIEAVGFNPL